MKKTSPIFKSIIVIATVTFLISCKKEIDRPQKPAAPVVTPFAMSKVPGIIRIDTLKTKP